MFSVTSSTPTLVPDQHSSASGGLPPLPPIRSEQIREQIFTHSSVTARRRGEFEVPPSNPIRDNEEWAHIGDQVISLAATDLIQDLHPLLRVGPTSKLRDRIKRSDTLAEIAVAYGLHEMLWTQDPRLKALPQVQVDVFKAYVGGLFREEGMDIVKKWLDPLFRPLVDDAYQAERRDHLDPAAPAALTAHPVRQRRLSLREVRMGTDTPHVGSKILGKRRRDPSLETGKDS
jgi:ribonuclease-3